VVLPLKTVTPLLKTLIEIELFMPRILFILFILLQMSVGNSLSAQSSQEEYLQENIEVRQFDDENYKKLTEGIEFIEEEKPEREENEKIDSKKFEGIGAFLKFFFIALGIGILVFFLVKALTNENLFAPRDKKLKPVTQIDLEKIEDNLEDAELNDPIQQAIAAGNFPLAVRLYYLAILQDLSLSKKIKWKKDKTNGEYLRELAGTSIFKNMQEITLVFERVWYGEVKINKNEFLKIEQLFLQMLPTKTVVK